MRPRREAPEAPPVPRLGLLSDSHAHGDITRRAVDLLLREGIDRLIHLGDIGSTDVLDALLAPARIDPGATSSIIPASAVLGNTDAFDRADLARHAAALGIEFDECAGRLATERGELIYLHGDDEVAMARALARRPVYLCHGHTHQRRDERLGPTRIINPGALYRAREHTVALLDTASDVLKFYRVDPR